jgi:class 3 adenylate cyclase
MRGLFIHAVVYAVVNVLLVGVWLVTTGSPEELARVSADPALALRNGFWPLAVEAGWGGAVVIHFGVWLAGLLFGGRRRRRARREAEREARREARRVVVAPKPPAPVAVTTWEPVMSVGQDLAKHATRAAIGLVESLANKATARPAVSGRHWVAVMFTDLVGSTDLAERLGDARWHALLAVHRRLVRECVGANRGTEVGTQGDGFLVRFDSPDAAVTCAVAIQRQTAASRRREPLMPELRVGIHAGEVMADDDDLIGRVINLAARINEAAEPGEILVTEPAADHLSPGVSLVDRGLRPLKGVGQPRHLLAVTWRE